MNGGMTGGTKNLTIVKRDPWVGKIPWGKAWQPTLVFLPGEPHGQKRLQGYHPQGHKELDTTETTEQTHAN